MTQARHPGAGAPTERFSSRVADYARYRPRYPHSVVELLKREIGLTADWRIADIGSGTGLSTIPFLEYGNEVIGVEPNRGMREAAGRLLAGWPRFRSIAGRAEDTGLRSESVDLIVAAQAFHWFHVDATRAEFMRVLRPNAWVALLWNTRRVGGDAFHEAYEALLKQFGTDYEKIRHDHLDAVRLDRFFGGPFVRHVLRNEQVLDLEGLRGRLRSSSYTPAQDKPEHEEMMRRLDEIFEEHERGGSVRVNYDLEVYVGQFGPAGTSSPDH